MGSTNKFGLYLLKQAQNRVLEHFEEARNNHYAQSTWISGWLDECEKQKLEEQGDKVECSVESGEYFYKIVFAR